MIVVSGDTDIRNYRKLMVHILENADLTRNFIFGRGPLDVLDHSSDSFSFGGKAGLDATIKYPEEKYGRTETVSGGEIPLQKITGILSEIPDIKSFNTDLLKQNIPVVIISLNPSADNETVERTKHFLRKNNVTEGIRLIIAVDHTVDINDLFMVSWQLLGNSDPLRDHDFLHDQTLFIDATIKAFRKGGFPRKWPNVVCSGEETINIIDQKWGSLGIGSLIVSPSLKYKALCREGKDEIII
jgi:4-hydroxy-3-polyprenylbenzoate decarboxylase